MKRYAYGYQRLGNDLFRYPYPRAENDGVAADGQYVNPVTVDEFRIAVPKPMMSLWSLRVRPIPSSHIHGQDRLRSRDTGHERGVKCAVPPLDPRPLLTMEDMGMGEWDMIWQEWTTARWEAWITARDDVYGRC